MGGHQDDPATARRTSKVLPNVPWGLPGMRLLEGTRPLRRDDLWENAIHFEGVRLS